jgi:hypothetical protein
VDRSVLTALATVAAVGVLALFLRRASGGTRDESIALPPPPDLEDEALEDAESAPDAVAMTSDGWAFVPDGTRVRLIAPAGPEADAGDILRGPAGAHLDSGDYAGARVVRGAPDLDPWRLETLGRDGEYLAFAFETEDAARAALALLESRIVSPPLDEDGHPRIPGEADYAAALERTLEGVSEIANDPGVASPDEGGRT